MEIKPTSKSGWLSRLLESRRLFKLPSKTGTRSRAACPGRNREDSASTTEGLIVCERFMVSRFAL